MRTSFSRRLSLLTFVIIVTGVLLFARLASFQFQLDVAAYLQRLASSNYRTINDRFPERGRIYDRNGELLAANTTEYRIGISPVYVSDKARLARELAEALGEDEAYILRLANSRAL